jgi:hypothetical protein
MDWITQNIELLVTYGLPVFPYLVIVLFTHQIMALFVKPIVTSHKNADGKYPSTFWRYARLAMIFLPPVLGMLMGLPFGLNLGYAAGSGVVSHYAHEFGKDWLAKKGIEIDPDVGNSDPPDQQE